MLIFFLQKKKNHKSHKSDGKNRKAFKKGYQNCLFWKGFGEGNKVFTSKLFKEKTRQFYAFMKKRSPPVTKCTDTLNDILRSVTISNFVKRITYRTYKMSKNCHVRSGVRVTKFIPGSQNIWDQIH